jgi:hypothetical protein
MIGERAIKSVGKAVTDKALGLGPGPFRAAMAAAVTGTATAALTYKLLRSDALGGSNAGDD